MNCWRRTSAPHACREPKNAAFLLHCNRNWEYINPFLAPSGRVVGAEPYSQANSAEPTAVDRTTQRD